ncbi:MAG: DUF488 domain-containing protein [Lentisphaerae bacterium]|nr:DUF488 domain-containing protein [Lentisphaerota bacterium]
MLKIKRIYEAPEPDDGCRILVDRLWPRGISKEKAALDLWLKEIAPSDELRHWFGHVPQRWSGFAQKYRLELQDKTELLQLLREKLSQGPLTLLYAAKDEQHNQAAVLAEVLQE